MQMPDYERAGIERIVKTLQAGCAMKYRLAQEARIAGDFGLAIIYQRAQAEFHSAAWMYLRRLLG